MNKILTSACLLGEIVRYDGRPAASADPILLRWLGEGRLVPFCPEVAGGLTVPRPPAEIDGTASSVRVVTRQGADVTAAFLRGAGMAVETARLHGCRIAILKDGSPSCGSHTIHDGTFSGRLVAKPGITAARLTAAGVRVFSEAEIAAAELWLEAMGG